jgi:hypothetical protein
MTTFPFRISKTLRLAFAPLQLAFVPLLAASAIHFAVGCSDSNAPQDGGIGTAGSASGTGSGATTGASSGSMSGATSGATSGSGSGTTSSGATSGSSSGAMSGASSGSASGSPGDDAGDAGDAGEQRPTEAGDDGATEAGDDGATEAGDDGSSADSGPTCSAGCMTAAGCPAQSCYIPMANPTGNAADSTMCDGITQMPTAWQPHYAVDGDPATRYSTCTAGVGTEWFQVDMCRTALVSGVTLSESTNDVGDQAAAYNVQVSMDGSNWTSVATASTVPRGTAVLTATFAPVVARYVRFNQTGMVGVPTADGGFTTKWWSIHEFNVNCAADDAGADASATDAAGDAPAGDAGDAGGGDSASDAASDVAAE